MKLTEMKLSFEMLEVEKMIDTHEFCVNTSNLCPFDYGWKFFSPFFLPAIPLAYGGSNTQRLYLAQKRVWERGRWGGGDHWYKPFCYNQSGREWKVSTK
jgi:hypothetical protein